MGGGRWSLGSAGKGTAVAGGAGGGEIEEGSIVERERVDSKIGNWIGFTVYRERDGYRDRERKKGKW